MEGPRKRLPPDQRRQQLVQCALELFARDGFSHVSVEDVAREADVNRALIYQHFGGKDGLYVAVLQSCQAAYDHAVQLSTERTRTPDPTDPTELIRLGIEPFFDFVETRPAEWTLLFAGGENLLPDPLAHQAREIKSRAIEGTTTMVKALRPDRPAQENEATAHLMSGAAEGLARWWQSHPEIGRGVVIDLLAAFLWSGLREDL